jgi:hypothetical protein
LPYDTATEDLQPLPIEQHLDLVTRRRPRERRLDPPNPQRLSSISAPPSEQLQHQPVKRILEVFGDDRRRLWVVLLLNRVRRRNLDGRILDDYVGLVELPPHDLVLLLELLQPPRRRVKDRAPLHLVKDRVVTPVDFVPSIHIRRQEEVLQSRLEALDLMR